MTLIDLSPSTSPSLDEQRDALQKGLGRAVQWAHAKTLSESLLLHACLTDLRYDMQVADARGQWLWQMVDALKAQQRFRVPILHALYELPEERSAYQLCELAGFYARAGDETFRTRLYEIIESRPFPDDPTLGEAQLLLLDGYAALEIIARRRGNELLSREWDWHDGLFIDKAIELLGENEVRSQLANTGDVGILRFRDRWDQVKRQQESQAFTPYQDYLSPLSLNDVLSSASEKNSLLGWFRGWGMKATESDLKAVLTRLWNTTSPPELACLLRVFSNRALPGFDPRLIELCQHTDDEVRRWAFRALEKNSDPAIREFALQRLRDGDACAVPLFVKNFEQGDEKEILANLDLSGDAEEIHSILFDVVDILKYNPEADSTHLGIVVYAVTPCENCRWFAVRRLYEQQVAPDWLKSEIRYDSAEDCRKLDSDGISTFDRK